MTDTVKSESRNANKIGKALQHIYVQVGGLVEKIRLHRKNNTQIEKHDKWKERVGDPWTECQPKEMRAILDFLC